MALLGNAASGNQILAQDVLAGVVASSYLISGTTPSTSANLTLTYGTQEATSNNGTLAQYIKLAAGTLAITASKDAYIDLGYSGTFSGGAANGTLTKVEVANGAAAPALTANSIRLWKVVSSGTALTAVTLLATTQPVSGTMVQTGSASGVSGLDGSKRVVDPSTGTAGVSNGAAANPAGTVTIPTTGIGLGTGGSASLVAGSTDRQGQLHLSIGTGPTPNNIIITVQYGAAYPNGSRVSIVPAWSGSGANTSIFGQPILVSASSTGFSLYSAGAALSASSTFWIDYLVNGY